MRCARCGGILATPAPGRRDTCPGCGADLRACIQCVYYAPGQYNDCHEPQADRVVEKERANFCDFFRLGSRASGTDPKAGARAALDALFRKKP